MSPIDKSKPIYINCVYVTHHPATGRFYIGKGQTRKVINKKYIGSGKRLRDEIMNDIHCVDNRICDPTGGSPEWLANKAYAYGWESEVLQTFRNKNDAFAFETGLIHENQNDPLNLNDGYLKTKSKIITSIIPLCSYSTDKLDSECRQIAKQLKDTQNV